MRGARTGSARAAAMRAGRFVSGPAAALLCAVVLTGCSMTPHFATAKELLNQYRQEEGSGGSDPFSQSGRTGTGQTRQTGTGQSSRTGQPGQAPSVKTEGADPEEKESASGDMPAGDSPSENVPAGILVNMGGNIPESLLGSIPDHIPGGTSGRMYPTPDELRRMLEELSRKEERAERDANAGEGEDSGRAGGISGPAPYLDGAHRLIPGWLLTRTMDLPAPGHRLAVLELTLTRMLNSFEGTWSAAVRDLRTGERIVINDIPMPSASDMKLFILGCVYEAIRTGRVERTAELVQRMNNMISASSNTDANELIRILGQGSHADGIAEVNAYIRANGYSENTIAYNPFQEESLILDPDHSNQTSADDTAEILERIYRRTFGNRSTCAEVEQMMLNGQTRYKLPSALPSQVSAGNKTGETDEVENDAMVVYTPAGDYILTLFSRDWPDKSRAQQRFKEVSAETYRYFSDPDYDSGLFPLFTGEAADAGDQGANDNEGKIIPEL